MRKDKNIRPFKIRPANATAEQALKYRQAGLTWDEIGRLWNGVSRQAVIQVVRRAEKAKLKAGG